MLFASLIYALINNVIIKHYSLYNDETNFFGEVVISKDKKDVSFLIKNFSFGQSFSAATNAKKNNAKLVLFPRISLKESSYL